MLKGGRALAKRLTESWLRLDARGGDIASSL